MMNFVNYTIIADSFIDNLYTFFMTILLTIDAIVYTVVGYIYQVFVLISRIQLFNDPTIADFRNKIYVIIGVVMLFVITFALLKALVNPDDLTKGDASPVKIVRNFIMALVMIAIVPTIFSYSRTLQNIVVEENVIGKIILGAGETTAEEQSSDLSKKGYHLAVYSFQAFFYTNDEKDMENVKPDNPTNEDGNLAITFINILEDGNFFRLPNYAKSVTTGTPRVNYFFLLSTAAGVYLLYIILSFCLDLGVRVVKLGFYEIIAPIPAMALVIPGQKKIFDNWVKTSVSVYIELFIRLVVIFFGVFVIGMIPNVWESIRASSSAYEFTWGVQLISQVIVILGIVTFMKQAPKLIGDMFGLDSGNMKLGIGEKLKAGGAFMAGGAIGGSLISAGKNLGSGIGAISSAVGAGNKAKAVGNMLKGVGTGLVAGGFKGAQAGNSAKGFGDFGRNVMNSSYVRSDASSDRSREAIGTSMSLAKEIEEFAIDKDKTSNAWSSEIARIKSDGVDAFAVDRNAAIAAGVPRSSFLGSRSAAVAAVDKNSFYEIPSAREAIDNVDKNAFTKTSALLDSNGNKMETFDQAGYEAALEDYARKNTKFNAAGYDAAINEEMERNFDQAEYDAAAGAFAAANEADWQEQAVSNYRSALENAENNKNAAVASYLKEQLEDTKDNKVKELTAKYNANLDNNKSYLPKDAKKITADNVVFEKRDDDGNVKETKSLFAENKKAIGGASSSLEISQSRGYGRYKAKKKDK